MNIICMTMVYNEAVMLPRWLRHYGGQFGNRSLMVIDHGSDDGSTDQLSASAVLRLCRSAKDELQRTEFVSNLARAMLGFYDAVIYTDCDEMLVADPAKYATLRDYVSSVPPHTCRRAVGFDVFQHMTAELPLDNDKPILAQRNFLWHKSGLCKPLITRAPVTWGGGFHSCDQESPADPDLYLFHLKNVDYQEAMKRLSFTRQMAWSDRALANGWGSHQRRSAEEQTQVVFRTPLDLLERQGGPLAFNPGADAKFHNDRLHEGKWLTVPPYAGSVYSVPKELKNVL